MLKKLAIVLLTVTTATAYILRSGSNSEQFNIPLSPDGLSQVIPPNFFGFTTGKPDNPEDYPPVSFPIGATGHSSTFAWWAIERQGRGQYNFTFYDQLMKTAAANHKTKWITFTWVPAWAEADMSSCGKTGIGGGVGNPTDGCTDPPVDNAYFSEMVQAVVDHYNGVTAPCVEFYELWNEAQSSFYWSGTAAQLAAMVQPAVAVIHASPCHSKVIGPSVTGPLTIAQTWMADFLAAGGSTMGLDGVSYHGYMGPNGCSPWPAPEQALNCGTHPTFGSADGRAKSFRAFYDTHGMAGKPMFMSEGGPWSKQSNLPDQDMQAAYAARYLALQASQYSQGLQQTYWYAWGYSSTDDNAPWDRISGADGNPNAAGVAIAELQKWLVGSYFTGDCTASGSIYSCSIVEPDATHALIVWDTAKTCSNGTCTTGTYTLPAAYTRNRDIAGVSTVLNSAATIQLGAKPVIVDFH